MSNYKNILKKKTDFLQYLLNKHENTLSDEKKNELNIIIYNAYQIINGEIDDLADNYRKNAILIIDELDSSLQFLYNLEKDFDSIGFDDAR